MYDTRKSFLKFCVFVIIIEWAHSKVFFPRLMSELGVKSSSIKREKHIVFTINLAFEM